MIRTLSAGAPSTPWNERDVLLGVASAILLVLVSAVIGLAFVPAGAKEPSPLVVLILTLVLEAVLVSVVVSFTVVKYHCGVRPLGLAPPKVAPVILWAAAGLGAALLFSYVYFVVVEALGLDRLADTPTPSFFNEKGPVWLGGALVATVMAPLAEELFFRGFVFPGLLRRIGLLWGAVVSAVLFALPHGDVATLIPIFLLGVLLAWVYYRTGSLWTSILVHCGFNLFAVTQLK